jgi:hypothetical protein
MNISDLKLVDLIFLAEIGKTENIALQAWNLLKVRPDLTVDTLNNLAKYGKTDEIRIEAQRIIKTNYYQFLKSLLP